MEVKDSILKELNRERRLNLLKPMDLLEQEYGEHTRSTTLSLEEISTIDLPFLSIPFLNGCVLDNLNKKEEALDSFREYNFLLERLCVVDPSLSSCCSSRSRGDKIKVYNLKKAFTFYFIDWEDRQWLIQLLEYFYILSCEKMYYLNREIRRDRGDSEIRRDRGDKRVSKNIEILKLEKSKLDLGREGIIKSKEYVDEYGKDFVEGKHITKDSIFSCGLPSSLTTVSFSREDFLRRRINPKYTLEEFGDVISQRLKEMEKQTKEGGPQQREMSLEEIRERDEEKDDKHVYRGNTDNVA